MPTAAALARFVALRRCSSQREKPSSCVRSRPDAIDVTIVDSVPLGVDTLGTWNGREKCSPVDLDSGSAYRNGREQESRSGRTGREFPPRRARSLSRLRARAVPTFEDAFAAIGSGEAEFGMILTRIRSRVASPTFTT
jgi:hypothetical protein